MTASPAGRPDSPTRLPLSIARLTPGSNMGELLPTDCPKYPSCICSICPLDPRWPKAVHLPGERVCPYVLATGKAGAEQRYAPATPCTPPAGWPCR